MRCALLLASSMLLTATAMLPATARVQAQAATDTRQPSVTDLTDAPHATMGMKLEKTFLKVDVLALTIRVDEHTAGSIGEIIEDHTEYVRDLEAPVAALAIAPRTAVAEIEFLLEGVSRKTLGNGQEKGLGSINSLLFEFGV